jgi:hypothetical protein
VYQNKTLVRLTDNPRGIPKFNSNFTYVIIEKRSKQSIMGDTPYDSLKAYVWLGSRSANYLANFESTMN